MAAVVEGGEFGVDGALVEAAEEGGEGFGDAGGVIVGDESGGGGVAADEVGVVAFGGDGEDGAAGAEVFKGFAGDGGDGGPSGGLIEDEGVGGAHFADGGAIADAGQGTDGGFEAVAADGIADEGAVVAEDFEGEVEAAIEGEAHALEEDVRGAAGGGGEAAAIEEQGPLAGRWGGAVQEGGFVEAIGNVLHPVGGGGVDPAVFALHRGGIHQQGVGVPEEICFERGVDPAAEGCLGGFLEETAAGVGVKGPGVAKVDNDGQAEFAAEGEGGGGEREGRTGDVNDRKRGGLGEFSGVIARFRGPGDGGKLIGKPGGNGIPEADDPGDGFGAGEAFITAEDEGIPAEFGEVLGEFGGADGGARTAGREEVEGEEQRGAWGGFSRVRHDGSG